MHGDLLKAAKKWDVRISLYDNNDPDSPIIAARNELEIAHELLEKIARQHPRSVEFLGNAWHIYEWLGPDSNMCWERFGSFIECVCAIAERATPEKPGTPTAQG